VLLLCFTCADSALTQNHEQQQQQQQQEEYQQQHDQENLQIAESHVRTTSGSEMEDSGDESSSTGADGEGGAAAAGEGAVDQDTQQRDAAMDAILEEYNAAQQDAAFEALLRGIVRNVTEAEGAVAAATAARGGIEGLGQQTEEGGEEEPQEGGWVYHS
jgi:hypothetical protein